MEFGFNWFSNVRLLSQAVSTVADDLLQETLGGNDAA